jgi:WD40 repeat protein
VITALAVTPDGKLLAVPGRDTIQLLDAQSLTSAEPVVHQQIPLDFPRVESLQFSPDSTRLAICGGVPAESGEFRVWDVTTGRIVCAASLTDDTLYGVCWSPDGRRVAVGGADTDLHVLDAGTGEVQLSQGAPTDWVLATAFSKDGQHLVMGSRDRTLRLIQVDNGQFIDQITSISPNIPSSEIYVVRRHPHRDQVAVGGEDGILRTYMMHRLVDRKIGDDNQLVTRYASSSGRIYDVAFNPAGTRVASASSNGREGLVQVFDVPEAWQPPDEIRLIQAKEVAKRTADESARLEAYHTAAAAPKWSRRLASPCYAVCYCGEGDLVLAGGTDGTLRVMRANDGTVLREHPVSAPGRPSAAAPRPPETSPPPVPHFLTDVMPVLSKLGCNSGTCHGSRTGQNGFALSLRGYAPLADHQALTDDLRSRRLDRSHPEQSLMLLKAAGIVAHEGGMVTEPQSRRYEILRRWIAGGAPYREDVPRVTRIELEPVAPVLDKAGDRVAMRVTAVYTDGSQRDVTADAFVESGNTECATAEDNGTLKALRRGEAAILARYEGSYAATTLTVMGDRGGFEWLPQPVWSPIDALVDAKLMRTKILPSEICGDAEFLRRVFLDLTGLPPTPDDIRKFTGDTRSMRIKRDEWIDRLVDSEAAIEHRTNRWSDLLMVNGRFLGPEGARAYRDWIRAAIASNMPYDQFVREILTATGSNRTHPQASYFKVLRTADVLCETSTQVFLGVRFNCNKCHDHPFERWTQDDYYGLAAFFGEVALHKDPESKDRQIAGTAVDEARPLYEMVADDGDGQVLHLRHGKAAAPRFPVHAELGAELGGDEHGSTSLRERAARWWTSPRNPYFASNHANRIWAQLTGVGLIEPVDDTRAGNPPTNPELLQWLTSQLVEHRFDTRHLIRTICKSRTYQLSSRTNSWNDDDRRNYSHGLPRRLPAEVLFDAVHQAAGAASHFPGVPAGTRAAMLPDSQLKLPGGLLEKLGRPARESGCECERSSDLQLGPVMALVNGPALADALADPENALARLERTTANDHRLVEEVFLRFLGRPPNADEAAAAVGLVAHPANDVEPAREALQAHVARSLLKFDDWIEANRPVAWYPLQPVEVSSTMGARLEVRADQSIVSSGPMGRGFYRVIADVPLDRIRSLRLETLADDSLPHRGPGRAKNGNFVLSQIRVWVAPPGNRDEWRIAKLRSAQADFQQKGYPVSNAIDAQPQSGWAIAGGTGSDHEAVFALARPLGWDGGTRVVVELDQQHPDAQHLLGRFRLSVANAPARLTRPGIPADIAAVLAIPSPAWTPDQRQLVEAHYLQSDPEYRQLEQATQLLENPRLAALQDIAWALINTPAFLFNH